ncbi:MAG: HAMP domain-containing sensor histidine kinase [Planctomycetia bacterium]|nr:HAMP domain-containing sensor histidine kinase [Planctomycetia bacterium]
MEASDSRNISSDREKELEQRKIDALAEFAAGAGHEINNPLAVISGHAQILLRETDDPNQAYHLGIILGQVKRAYEMIADIRTFARPPLPQICALDLSLFWDDFIQNQKKICEDHSVDLQCEFAEMEDLRSYQIFSDPSFLQAILIPLVRNSLDALPNGGTIQIHSSFSISSQNDQGILSVDFSDNGPGIPAEIREQIFSPYFSGRSAGRGLGFGLPKVWRLLQQLNGSIVPLDPEDQKIGCGWHLEIPLMIK